jgi:hypothetical protein
LARGTSRFEHDKKTAAAAELTCTTKNDAFSKQTDKDLL